MAESIIKNRGIKSASFSGTTDSTGNCVIAPLSQGVVVSIREVHNYLPIFMVTSGNNNYAKFINISASTFQPVANSAVSGTYYYLDS